MTVFFFSFASFNTLSPFTSCIFNYTISSYWEDLSSFMMISVTLIFFTLLKTISSLIKKACIYLKGQTRRNNKQYKHLKEFTF